MILRVKFRRMGYEVSKFPGEIKKKVKKIVYFNQQMQKEFIKKSRGAESKDFMRSEERWELFADELFRQPEFAGITGSVGVVITMFDQTIRERALFHGWLDVNGGVTGNLSNEI